MKCVNCRWKGGQAELSKNRFCPVCGDNVEASPVEPSHDLNRDGKIDKKDVSLAAKVMAKQKKKR